MTHHKYKFNYISSNLIQKIEERDRSAIETAKPFQIPYFSTGDILSVKSVSSCSSKKRQTFLGVCISKKNKGLRSSFILRNMLDGDGIECSFPLYNPMITQIQILKRKKTRASKLYYLRNNKYRSHITS